MAKLILACVLVLAFFVGASFGTGMLALGLAFYGYDWQEAFWLAPRLAAFVAMIQIGLAGLAAVCSPTFRGGMHSVWQALSSVDD